MTQQWLTVIGLGLDIVGFLMIVLEWRNSLLGERDARLVQIRREARGGSWGKKPEVRDQLIGEGAKDLDQELSHRRWIFFSGVALVVIGFALQMLGNWPGCCPAIWVRPSAAATPAIAVDADPLHQPVTIPRSRYRRVWPPR